VDDVDLPKGTIQLGRKAKDGASMIEGIVPGAGEGGADGVEAIEEGMCGDSGVLFPAAVSLPV
jgi:hypothetical protein